MIFYTTKVQNTTDTWLSILVSCFSIRIILVPASCVSYTAAPQIIIITEQQWTSKVFLFFIHQVKAALNSTFWCVLYNDVKTDIH